MIGHRIGHGLVGTSDQFDWKAESMDVLSDVKDGALYGAGGGLANNVMRTSFLKPLTSSGEKVLTHGLSRSIRLMTRSPFKGTGRVLTHGTKLAWHGMKGMGGGATRGVITEAPAAFTDVGYQWRYGNGLDPTGELHALGISEWRMAVRALTLRLGTAGFGGAMGHAFQGMRGGLAKVGTGNRFLQGDGIGQRIGRTILRSKGEIVTIPELGVDVWNAANVEAITAGWFYGKDDRASPEQLEQIIVSSLAGHIAGRTNGAMKDHLTSSRRKTAQTVATRLGTSVDAQASDAGVTAPRVVTVIGGEDVVTVRQDPTLKPAVGQHLGGDERVAAHIGSRQEHRLKGEAAQNIDKNLGGRVDRVAKAAIAQADAVLHSKANHPGSTKHVSSDRTKAAEGFKDGMSRRAAQQSMIGEKPDVPGEARDKYVQRLGRDIQSYSHELNGKPGGVVGWIRKAIANADNPYLNSKQKVRLTQDNPGVDADVKAGWVRKLVDSTWGVRRVGKWLDTVSDRTANFLESRRNAWHDFSERPILGFPIRLASPAVSKVFGGSLRVLTNVAAGIYTTPTTTIWGSWGVGYSLGIGGLGLLAQGAQASRVAGSWMYRNLGGESFIYRNGDGYEAGQLLAKKVQGVRLLKAVEEINADQPGTFSRREVNRLRAEVDETAKRFERANVRHGGLVAGSIAKGIERVAEYPSSPGEVRASLRGARKAENRDRMIAESTLTQLERVANRLYAQAEAENAGRTIQRLSDDLRTAVTASNMSLKRVEKLCRALLREGSEMDPTQRENLRAEIDSLLVMRPIGDDPTGSKTQKIIDARQVVARADDPEFALRSHLAQQGRGRAYNRRTDQLVSELIQETQALIQKKGEDNIGLASRCLQTLRLHSGLEGASVQKSALKDLQDFITGEEAAGRLKTEVADSLRRYTDVSSDISHSSKIELASDYAHQYRDSHRMLASEKLSSGTIGDKIEGRVEVILEGSVRGRAAKVSEIEAEILQAVKDAEYVLEASDLGKISGHLRSTYLKERRAHLLHNDQVLASKEFVHLLDKVAQGDAKAEKVLSKILWNGLTRAQKTGLTRDNVVDQWKHGDAFRNDAIARLQNYFSSPPTSDSLWPLRELVRFEGESWKVKDLPDTDRFAPLLKVFERLKTGGKAEVESLVKSKDWQDFDAMSETAAKAAKDLFKDQIEEAVRKASVFYGDMKSRALVADIIHAAKKARKESKHFSQETLNSVESASSRTLSGQDLVEYIAFLEGVLINLSN